MLERKKRKMKMRGRKQGWIAVCLMIWSAHCLAGVSVQTLMELRSETSLSGSEFYLTSGYWSDDDGGGGTYRYDAVSTLTANGGTVVDLDTLPGRLMLQYNGDLNVKQFGAKGDGSTDDSDAINNCLSAGDRISVPPGSYVVNSTVVIEDGKAFSGSGCSGVNWGGTGTRLLAGTGCATMVELRSGAFLGNMFIDGNSTAEWGVLAKFGALHQISNITIRYLTEVGLGFDSVQNANLTGVKAYDSQICIGLFRDTANCIFHGCDTRLWLDTGNSAARGLYFGEYNDARLIPAPYGQGARNNTFFGGIIEDNAPGNSYQIEFAETSGSGNMFYGTEISIADESLVFMHESMTPDWGHLKKVGFYACCFHTSGKKLALVNGGHIHIDPICTYEGSAGVQVPQIQVGPKGSYNAESMNKISPWHTHLQSSAQFGTVWGTMGNGQITWDEGRQRAAIDLPAINSIVRLGTGGHTGWNESKSGTGWLHLKILADRVQFSEGNPIYVRYGLDAAPWWSDIGVLENGMNEFTIEIPVNAISVGFYNKFSTASSFDLAYFEMESYGLPAYSPDGGNSSESAGSFLFMLE